MSQRRGAKESGGAVQKNEEMQPFSKSLDNSTPSQPLPVDGPQERPQITAKPTEISQNEDDDTSRVISLDERYHAESQQLKMRMWKESYFARGFTEATWEAEYKKYKGAACKKMMDCNDRDNSAPCGCFSALCATFFGFGRIGNMVILKQSTEWVTEEVTDEENPNGGMKSHRFTQPKFDCIVGPYWPMLCMITYPLILGVSGFTLFTAIPKINPLLAIVWAFLTIGLIVALSLTACRDPGILRRHNEAPPGEEGSSWRWNDRALSYRPRGAWYDSDTGVIVDGFDHTCPWTGTAIGKKNMLAFQCFVSLVFVCLVFDIVLLTGSSI